MKNQTFLILILLFAQTFSLFGQTSNKEERTVIYPTQGANEKCLLEVGESVEHTYTFQQHNYPTRKMMRVIGGVNMPAPFQRRGEEMNTISTTT